jgi:hypothetical protein
MKNAIKQLTLILALLGSLVACKKPCEDVNCQRGYCDDGTCICPDGYYGSRCELGGPSASGQTPTGFRIYRVTISNVPQCWSSGTPIDGAIPGDYPDIIAKLQVGSNIVYTTGVDFDATQVSFDNLNWTVNSMTQNCTLKIYDQDDLGPVSTDVSLVNIGFNGGTLDDEPDNAFSTQIQNGFSSACYPNGSPSWVRAYFELTY